jgi:hypothetical protein
VVIGAAAVCLAIRHPKRSTLGYLYGGVSGAVIGIVIGAVVSVVLISWRQRSLR